MIFITISEELNYQFVFLSLPHFSKLCMYTYINWISYFDSIVDGSSVNNVSCKFRVILFLSMHEKNDFAERSKIYFQMLNTDLKIILLDHQINFVGTSKIMSDAAKNCDIPATSLSVLHNYFDSSTKLFLITDLYVAKILNLSKAKLFCSCDRIRLETE